MSEFNESHEMQNQWVQLYPPPVLFDLGITVILKDREPAASKLLSFLEEHALLVVVVGERECRAAQLLSFLEEHALLLVLGERELSLPLPTLLPSPSGITAFNTSTSAASTFAASGGSAAGAAGGNTGSFSATLSSLAFPCARTVLLRLRRRWRGGGGGREAVSAAAMAALPGGLRAQLVSAITSVFIQLEAMDLFPDLLASLVDLLLFAAKRTNHADRFIRQAACLGLRELEAAYPCVLQQYGGHVLAYLALERSFVWQGYVLLLSAIVKVCPAPWEWGCMYLHVSWLEGAYPCVLQQYGGHVPCGRVTIPQQIGLSGLGGILRVAGLCAAAVSDRQVTNKDVFRQFSLLLHFLHLLPIAPNLPPLLSPIPPIQNLCTTFFAGAPPPFSLPLPWGLLLTRQQGEESEGRGGGVEVGGVEIVPSQLPIAGQRAIRKAISALLDACQLASPPVLACVLADVAAVAASLNLPFLKSQALQDMGSLESASSSLQAHTVATIPSSAPTIPSSARPATPPAPFVSSAIPPLSPAQPPQPPPQDLLPAHTKRAVVLRVARLAHEPWQPIAVRQLALRWLLALEVDGVAAGGGDGGLAGNQPQIHMQQQQQHALSQQHSHPYTQQHRRRPILAAPQLASALSIRLFDPLALKAAKTLAFARIAAAALCSSALPESARAAMSASAMSASATSAFSTSDAAAASQSGDSAAADAFLSASRLQQQLLHESMAALSLFYYLPPSSLDALLALRTLRCFLTATPLPLLSSPLLSSPHLPSSPLLSLPSSIPLSHSHSDASQSLSSLPLHTHHPLTINIASPEHETNRPGLPGLSRQHSLLAPRLSFPAPPPSILSSVQAYLLSTLTAMPDHIPNLLFFLSCLSQCPHHHPLSRALHRTLFSQLIPLLSQFSPTLPPDSSADKGIQHPSLSATADAACTADRDPSAGYLTAQPLLVPLSLCSVPRYLPLLHSLSANLDVPPGPIVDLLLAFLQNERERRYRETGGGGKGEGRRGGKGGRGEAGEREEERRREGGGMARWPGVGMSGGAAAAADGEGASWEDTAQVLSICRTILTSHALSVAFDPLTRLFSFVTLHHPDITLRDRARRLMTRLLSVVTLHHHPDITLRDRARIFLRLIPSASGHIICHLPITVFVLRRLKTRLPAPHRISTRFFLRLITSAPGHIIRHLLLSSSSSSSLPPAPGRTPITAPAPAAAAAALFPPPLFYTPAGDFSDASGGALFALASSAAAATTRTDVTASEAVAAGGGVGGGGAATGAGAAAAAAAAAAARAAANRLLADTAEGPPSQPQSVNMADAAAFAEIAAVISSPSSSLSSSALKAGAGGEWAKGREAEKGEAATAAAACAVKEVSHASASVAVVAAGSSSNEFKSLTLSTKHHSFAPQHLQQQQQQQEAEWYRSQSQQTLALLDTHTAELAAILDEYFATLARRQPGDTGSATIIRAVTSTSSSKSGLGENSDHNKDDIIGYEEAEGFWVRVPCVLKLLPTAREELAFDISTLGQTRVAGTEGGGGGGMGGGSASAPAAAATSAIDMIMGAVVGVFAVELSFRTSVFTGPIEPCLIPCLMMARDEGVTGEDGEEEAWEDEEEWDEEEYCEEGVLGNEEKDEDEGEESVEGGGSTKDSMSIIVFKQDDKTASADEPETAEQEEKEKEEEERSFNADFTRSNPSSSSHNLLAVTDQTPFDIEFSPHWPAPILVAVTVTFTSQDGRTLTGELASIPVGIEDFFMPAPWPFARGLVGSRGGEMQEVAGEGGLDGAREGMRGRGLVGESGSGNEELGAFDKKGLPAARPESVRTVAVTPEMVIGAVEQHLGRTAAVIYFA
ncbi:unnamed protein product [Closterium sp. NIES-65]|nr:unnamed protein product [Closterium sp. NIES-65]